MAANDLDQVKPHSHHGLAAIAFAALVMASGSLVMHACPPVPAPAVLPASVAPQPTAAPAVQVVEEKVVAVDVNPAAHVKVVPVKP
jgi:hypothetical protein